MRFNSVIRSMAVWANMTNLDTMRPKLVERVVDTMYNALLDEKTREKYLDSEDKTEIYLSLWAEATHDVSKIDEKVEYLMSKKEDYKTVTATCFLNTITREKVKDATISKILMETDNYEVIAWVSVILGLRFNYSLGYEIVKKLEPIQVRSDNDTKLSKELAQAVFEKYQILFDKIKGKSGTIEILDSGVEGNILTIYKESLEEGMFIAASELNDDKKIEELMSLVSSGKVKKAYLNNYVYKLRNESDRAFLIECIGNGRDNNLQKQAKVYVDLLKIKFTDEEILFVEGMLRLKSPDSRSIALEYLGNQEPDKIYDSIERLLSNSKLENRLGGLDLVVNKISTKDKKVYKKLEKLLEDHKIKSPAEQVLIDKFLDGDGKEGLYTMENGLGFYSEKEEVILAKLGKTVDFDLKKDLFSMPYKEFKKYADKLNKLFEENQNLSYSVINYDGTSTDMILGSYRSLKKPVNNYDGEQVDYVEIDQFDNLYLSEVWREFFKKNDIPMEFIQEVNYLNGQGYLWGQIDEAILDKMLKMTDEELLKDDQYANENKAVIKLLPIKEIVQKVNLFRVKDNPNHYYYKAEGVKLSLFDEILSEYKHMKDEDISEDLFKKGKRALHKLYLEIDDEYYSKGVPQRWKEDTIVQQNIVCNLGIIKYLRSMMWRNIKDIDERLEEYLIIMNAFFEKSIEIDKDLIWQVKGEFLDDEDVATGYEKGLLSANYFYRHALNSNIIKQFTRERLYYRETEFFKDKYPKGNALIEKLVDRLVDIEIDRGDTQTIVSKLVANNVENYKGADYFVRLLSRLDYKETFARNVDNYWGIDESSRKSMISGLIKRNAPRENEGIKDFEKLLKGKKIPTELLVDVAMYNENWTDIICEYIGWQGLK